MKIVIAGAGAVGFHLAELLARENLNITLVDSNEEVLQQAGRHLDVLTIQGDVVTAQTLEEIGLKNVKLFIAVTTSEKTNLLSAILAKKLGAQNTIARISNVEHLKKESKNRFKQLGIDILISPEKLASLEIERLLQRASFTDLFEFENGKISIVGFTLGTSCPLVNQPIGQLGDMTDNSTFRCIALLREHHIMMPNDDTILKKGDHLYISTRSELLGTAMKFVGKQPKPIKNVMIIGGTPLALRAAQQIEKKYAVTLVLEDKEMAKKFAQVLNKGLVINADPSDIDSLKEENLEQMDAFIALTPNSETNIITSLMAEELGLYKTIASVENVDYTHISQNIGIDTIINKKLICANNIFRFVRKGKVEAIASLHGVDAEIIEFTIQKKNRLLHHPLKELHFPKKSTIAGVIRGKYSFVPEGNFQFKINDKVIILALPEAIHQVEKIFQ